MSNSSSPLTPSPKDRKYSSPEKITPQEYVIMDFQNYTEVFENANVGDIIRDIPSNQLGTTTVYLVIDNNGVKSTRILSQSTGEGLKKRKSKKRKSNKRKSKKRKSNKRKSNKRKSKKRT